MPLNIKNEQAHILAKELAHLMDESITTAVTKAISEALDRRRNLCREK
ncbi:MAG: type II toxin-antitoxin system VapB family antitoxin, partial [Spirochaetia bacterium]|nr:type II toxin-antitoxin system VapB family antitoxin [Spirochaetia bacterium]